MEHLALLEPIHRHDIGLQVLRADSFNHGQGLGSDTTTELLQSAPRELVVVMDQFWEQLSQLQLKLLKAHLVYTHHAKVRPGCPRSGIVTANG